MNIVVFTPHIPLTSWKNPTCARQGCQEKPNGGLALGIDTKAYMEQKKITPLGGLGYMTIVFPLCDGDFKEAEKYFSDLGFRSYFKDKGEMRIIPEQEMRGWAEAEEGNIAQMKR